MPLPTPAVRGKRERAAWNRTEIKRSKITQRVFSTFLSVLNHLSFPRFPVCVRVARRKIPSTRLSRTTKIPRSAPPAILFYVLSITSPRIRENRHAPLKNRFIRIVSVNESFNFSRHENKTLRDFCHEFYTLVRSLKIEESRYRYDILLV